MGAMAANLHGARRTTDDVDILLTGADLERFRQEMVPKYYSPIEGRPRRFRERKSGVLLDILVTGKFPGSGKPGPFAFPDPAKGCEREPERFAARGANCEREMGHALHRLFPFVDNVCSGEGDIAFPVLARRIVMGQPVGATGIHMINALRLVAARPALQA